MDGVHLALSFHQKWIASTAKDGKLAIRHVAQPVSSLVLYKSR